MRPPIQSAKSLEREIKNADKRLRFETALEITKALIINEGFKSEFLLDLQLQKSQEKRLATKAYRITDELIKQRSIE